MLLSVSISLQSDLLIYFEWYRLDGKTKFKIIMKGEKEYKKITNKFKIKQEKKDRGSPLKKNIIEIIKELCLK